MGLDDPTAAELSLTRLPEQKKNPPNSQKRKKSVPLARLVKSEDALAPAPGRSTRPEPGTAVALCRSVQGQCDELQRNRRRA